MRHMPGDGYGRRMVSLNGKQLNYVAEADDLEGWVRVFVVDDKGQFIRDDTNNCVKSEILYGNVEVIFTDGTGE